MREVSDGFLLNMAEVSATLIGLFLVGVFFYIESGFGRVGRTRAISQPYLRAGTRITLIVFTIPLGLSMALVVLEPIWARILFVVLSLLLISANVESVVRIRGVRSIALLVNEGVTTGLTLLLIVLPWALGGLHPTREDLTWAILLSFAAGFLSISATVMSAFDIARLEVIEEEAVDAAGDAESDEQAGRNDSLRDSKGIP